MEDMTTEDDSTPQRYNFEINSVKLIQPLDSNVPSPRSGHRIVCDESDLYVLGGYSNVGAFNAGSPNLFDELWKYNFAQNAWTQLYTTGPFPKELASHSLVLRDKTLIAYGGTKVPFGSGASNKVHSINLDTLKWVVLVTTGESPPPLYGQAVRLIGSSLYVCGGTDGITYNNDIYKLNLDTCHWEELFISKGDCVDNESSPRYRHELAVYEGTILILGGGTSSGMHGCVGTGFESLHGFNIHSRNWTKFNCRSEWRCLKTGEEGFPSPRLAHGCVQYGDSVWISGGRHGEVILGDIWKLHLPTLTWTRLPTYKQYRDVTNTPPFIHVCCSALPSHIYFHGATVTPYGCSYIFGGLMDRNFTRRVNELSKFWVGVPSLKEVCWETLKEIFPQITKTKPEILIQLGIPREFVARFPPSNG